MMIYRAQIETDQLNDFLHMILIFTSAALKSPYPLEMLANVANPEYVSVLLKMLINASPMNKLTIISIIKNLIRVNVPFEIF
jgi:hypothetical protein